MTAKILRILQIGDLHYDPNSPSFLDDKDSAFSRDLSSMIATSPVEDSLRSIITNAEKKNCDAIVVMGDIGDKGKKDLYRAGVHFLLDAMTENPILKQKIVVLPGNHDVNRDDALIGITEKFEHIARTLAEVGLTSVEIQKPTVKPLRQDNCQALLFALNSCIGCGERRFLPERIGDKIQTLITDALKVSSAPVPGPHHFPDMLTQYYEQLDTPALDATAMDNLFSQAAEATTEEAPVIVVASHHNLLPQAQPRIAPYSELVNGGQFRNHLLQLNRPVIYLHGHTHSETVEIIQQPTHPHSMVLCISAPLVSRGYNIIEILFNSDGAAFGCRIVRYRISDGGKVTEQPDPIKIPFYRTIEQAMNALNGKIMAYVFAQKGRPAYWPNLIQHLHKTDPDLAEDILRDAITELSWNRYLVLRNESQQHKLWRIEGTI